MLFYRLAYTRVERQRSVPSYKDADLVPSLDLIALISGIQCFAPSMCPRAARNIFDDHTVPFRINAEHQRGQALQ